MCTIRNNHSKKGFTLVESAIVMLILAVVMGAAIVPYKLWRMNQVTLQTNLNMDSVTAGFTNFLTQNGRYPCPARTDIDRTHVDYGMEGICDNTDPGYPAVVTSGTCSNGICFEDGARDVDIDTDPTVNPLVPVKVRRGSIPFRVLGITEDQSEDGYGNRIQYAISENLATSDTYIDTSGAIAIVDGSPLPVSRVDPPGSAHYIILSSGNDQNGAISREGRLIKPCFPNRKDTENCNTEMGNADDELAIYSLAARNTSGSNDHNDDTLKFYSSFVTPLWRTTDDSGLHIRDLIDVAAGGSIGINRLTPLADVDVNGEVRVDGGDSKVESLCPQNSPGSCFSVENFGDPVGHTDFECPAGTVATGFGAGKITCSSSQTVRCLPGERLMGIDASGNLQCGNFNGCPSKNVTICGDVTNLPAMNQDSDPGNESGSNPAYRWPVGGPNDLTQKWHCGDTSSGHPNTWHQKPMSGGAYDRTCGACAPGVVINSGESCSNVLDGFWDGNIDEVTTTTCSPQLNTITYDYSPCICRDDTAYKTLNCPAGFNTSVDGKKIVHKRDWTCSTPSAGTWGSWSLSTDYCRCEPEVETSSPSCPFAQSGSISRHRGFTCPGGALAPGTMGSWIEDSNTCVCNATPSVETKTVGCPTGYAGNVQMKRTYDCLGGGVWDAWQVISDDCGLIQLTWRAGSSSTGGTSPADIQVGDNCVAPGATASCSVSTGSGGVHINYSDCVCE